MLGLMVPSRCTKRRRLSRRYASCSTPGLEGIDREPLQRQPSLRRELRPGAPLFHKTYLLEALNREPIHLVREVLAVSDMLQRPLLGRTEAGLGSGAFRGASAAEGGDLLQAAGRTLWRPGAVPGDVRTTPGTEARIPGLSGAQG